MKRFLVWMAVLALGTAGIGQAQSVDEMYVRIYHLIQQADEMKQGGQARPAYEKYQQAQLALEQLQKTNPTWNENLVKYRLNYIKQRLSQITPPPPATMPADSTAPSPRPVAGAAPPVEAASPSTTARPDLENQVRQLTSEVRRLESEKNLLDARLREALSAQPATIDPRELARAETRIRTLQKENDLLKVTLGQEQDRMTKLVDPSLVTKTQKALANANQRLADQTRQVSMLIQEKKLLESRLRSQPSRPEIQTLQAENAQLKKQAAALNAKPGGDEAQKLKSQFDRQKTEIETLRADKRLLEKQLADLRDQQDKNLSRRERAQLSEQRATVESLRTENRDLEQEKRSLEKELASLKNRVQELQSGRGPAVSPTPPPVSREVRAAASQDANRIKALERDRDALKRRLDGLLRELNALKTRPDQVRWQQLSNQVTTLQARLDALEAQKVPYTPEEAALLRSPLVLVSNLDSPATNNTAPVKRPSPDLPSGAAPIVAEAQRAFAAGRYDEAEQKYRQVLSLDSQNAFTLGNLAAIQIEQKKYEEAEANLKKAMELDPKDAFNLSLFGILKFRQEKYDEALTALSQSARLDPKNAEAQNYLGITLSEKGFRDAAETALRRAIQIQPDYANAHHNLAVIYATQNPPYVELARWHYQKALSSGHPRNLEMEKILLDRKPATTTKQ